MARPWKVVDLESSENVKPAAVKVLRSMFQQVRSYEQATLKGNDPEALHNMRVALRRLRVLMKLFSDCFPKRKLRNQQELLQTMTGLLGSVREHDLLIEELRSFRTELKSMDTQAIDLLIAREVIQRKKTQAKAAREIRKLGRRNYGDAFERLLSA
ncbi:MAG TPA: CHAD domain-containing protein [Bacteroidota bacterium]|nr:CHAD domain-containing protein [Bacteroidota bacterium]